MSFDGKDTVRLGCTGRIRFQNTHSTVGDGAKSDLGRVNARGCDHEIESSAKVLVQNGIADQWTDECARSAVGQSFD